MKELNVLIDLVQKLLNLGYMGAAEQYAANEAIEKLKNILKEEPKKEE